MRAENLGIRVQGLGNKISGVGGLGFTVRFTV